MNRLLCSESDPPCQVKKLEEKGRRCTQEPEEIIRNVNDVEGPAVFLRIFMLNTKERLLFDS